MAGCASGIVHIGHPRQGLRVFRYVPNYNPSQATPCDPTTTLAACALTGMSPHGGLQALDPASVPLCSRFMRSNRTNWLHDQVFRHRRKRTVGTQCHRSRLDFLHSALSQISSIGLLNAVCLIPTPQLFSFAFPTRNKLRLRNEFIATLRLC